jgi:hypothetical protein
VKSRPVTANVTPWAPAVAARGLMAVSVGTAVIVDPATVSGGVPGFTTLPSTMYNLPGAEADGELVTKASPACPQRMKLVGVP